MWKCIHTIDCTQPGTFDVVRAVLTVQDEQGNILDSDPNGGENTSASCAECGCPASTSWSMLIPAPTTNK